MIRKTIGAVGFALVIVAGLAGLLAQVGTPAPGMPTANNVWVENRGEQEAVAVSIENVAPNAPPLRVQLAGPGGGAPQVQAARQTWEYEGVRISTGQDPAAMLNAAGADGWEATGAVVVFQGSAVFVMKRPR